MKGKITEIPEFGFADVALVEDMLFREEAFLKGRIEGLKAQGIPKTERDVLVQPDRENIKRLRALTVRMRVQIERMGFEKAGIPKIDHLAEMREALKPQLREMLKTLETCPENQRGEGQVEGFRLRKLMEYVEKLDKAYNKGKDFGVAL